MLFGPCFAVLPRVVQGPRAKQVRPIELRSKLASRRWRSRGVPRSEAEARDPDFPQLNAYPPAAAKINPPQSPPNTQPTQGQARQERLKFAPVDNSTPCGQPDRHTPAYAKLGTRESTDVRRR
ncbi:hypothetical protein Aglo01_54000 [Actinokineospora globicatena]|nr:hypothetical protein Aglo01_54000 [Actinokineospora globicatena]GLW88112.1 hypothetical protein Aglo02_57510 [Actinokineospora globicatena]